jgi:hypothetical protein
MATGAADTGASRDGATTPGNAAAATDAGAGAASGAVGIAVAGGAGAITIEIDIVGQGAVIAATTEGQVTAVGYDGLA